MDRVGIILAGGNNIRLRPCSLATCKSLVPVYNKPLIYYSLSLLLLAQIREILIISTPRDLLNFQRLFKDGSQLGLNIQYKEQPSPGGLPQAFILGEEFINGRPSCLVLGDNLLYGQGLSDILRKLNRGIHIREGSAINYCGCLGYRVNNPEQYGVFKFNNQEIVDIIEKPKEFVSNYAIPGIYFVDETASEKCKTLKPSKRDELEIVDLLKSYLSEEKLYVELINRGIFWADCGNQDSLLDSSNFIAAIEQRMGLKIAAIEEICYLNGWIDKNQLLNLATELGNNEYSKYLQSLV